MNKGQRYVSVIVAALAPLLIWTCTHHTQSKAIQISVSPPVPGPTSPPPPLETSSVAVEISTSALKLSQVCSELNSSIPNTVSEDPGHQCLQWGVYHSRPLQCLAVGNRFHAQVTFEYRAGQRCGFLGIGQVSCGYKPEPARLMTIHTDAVLTWDPAWHLDAFGSTGLSLDTTCEGTVFNIDLDPLVRGLAQPYVDTINSKIPGIVAGATDFRPQATAVWRRLNLPIPLGHDLYLLLHPFGIGASNPNVFGPSISLTAELFGHPELVIASSPPPAGPLPPLPPLQTACFRNQFHIALNAFVSWKTASDLLSKRFVGKTYSAPLLKQIRVQRVAVSGHGNQALIAVTLDGGIEGTIYLMGTPVYLPMNPTVNPNGTKEAVTIPNLEFTTETRNTLLKAVTWLLHSTLRDDLRASSQFQLTEQIEDLQQQLQAALNQSVSPHFLLRGRVNDLAPRGVYVERDGVSVQMIADGRLIVTMH
jgi:hypothetical protein